MHFKASLGIAAFCGLALRSCWGSNSGCPLVCASARLFLAYAIAIPVGIISAATNNRVLDNSLKFVSYLGLALPNFLLALMIMLFSTVWFGETLTGLVF